MLIHRQQILPFYDVARHWAAPVEGIAIAVSVRRGCGAARLW
jgi:hypothetical protein